MLTTLDYMKIFHETKNSVTLINSSLQLIEKKHPDVAAYPLWKDTMQEVTYLKNLIAELSLSRTGYPLNLSLVAPADFIREKSQTRSIIFLFPRILSVKQLSKKIFLPFSSIPCA